MEYFFSAGLIILGILLCFFGYRLFRVSLAVFGFILGFGLGEMGYLVFYPSSHGNFWYYFCAMFCGFLFAFLSFSIYRLGILFMALSVTASVMASLYYILFGNVQITFVYALILLILGLFGGFAALKLQRPLVILYTSLGGGCLVAKALTLTFNQNFFFTLNAAVAGAIALALAILGILEQMRAARKKRRKRVAQ